MRKFDRRELSRFLRCVDSHLSEPRKIMLIGGAAAALAYQVRWVTTDVDTVDDVTDLEEAFARSRTETGLDVIVHQSGIWDAPYHFEDRLLSIDLSLQRLILVVPEKHDLVLMKVVRGQANDREAIQQIADQVGLDEPTLVERFRTEMTHVTGDPIRIRANFLAVIEMLFGEASADRSEARLRDRP